MARSQTYHAIEVIVVDDGSTDRTTAIVEDFAARDHRFRLFRRPKSGLSASRNFEISQARGALIAPLDADDLWHREKLSRQVARIQASPGIGAVYCWTVEIDEYDYIIPPIRKGNTVEGNVLIEMVSANIVASGSNLLIRRCYFETVGGYAASLHHGEDWRMNLSLAEICEFAVVPAHLVGYRRSRESASRDVTAMAMGMEAVSNWIIEKWPNTPPEALQKMIYRRNDYLANRALTNNQFRAAMRYDLQGLKAWPQIALSPNTAGFAVRLLARVAGIKRHYRLTSFRDFSMTSTGVN